MNDVKTVILDNNLGNIVRWDLSKSSAKARELLKTLTDVDCTPCEGSCGTMRGTLDYHEDYTGKGHTVVYEWIINEDGSVRIDYIITDNDTWDGPTPAERLKDWFDNAPEEYDVYRVLELAAREAANDGSNMNVWGQAHAIACMSGIHVADVMAYISYHASVTYGKTVRNVAA